MHCLNPLEGQNSWPSSDRVKPKAPGYVKLPGRPKKCRKREPNEPPKATKVCKLGSKMTCSGCKLTGHNYRTCPTRSRSTTAQHTATSSGVTSQSHPVRSHMPNTQESQAMSSAQVQEHIQGPTASKV